VARAWNGAGVTDPDSGRGRQHRLIEGETGPCKILVSEPIHTRGRRAHRPFVPSTPRRAHESLLASQLLGHKRGPSTAPWRIILLLLEAASGGTNLSGRESATSAHCGNQLAAGPRKRKSPPRRVDAAEKSMCACSPPTHRNLSAEVEKGGVPRRSHVPHPFGAHHQARVARTARGQFRCCSAASGRARRTRRAKSSDAQPERLRVFLAYPWPGNVLEPEERDRVRPPSAARVR